MESAAKTAAPSTKGAKRTQATKKMDFFDSDDGEMVAPKPPARKRANTAAPKKVAPVAPVQQPKPEPVSVSQSYVPEPVKEEVYVPAPVVEKPKPAAKKAMFDVSDEEEDEAYVAPKKKAAAPIRATEPKKPVAKKAMFDVSDEDSDEDAFVVKKKPAATVRTT